MTLRGDANCFLNKRQRSSSTGAALALYFRVRVQHVDATQLGVTGHAYSTTLSTLIIIS